ncbi:hypothetical protein INS49_003315 [Diaporthe citri]|uniref:uncharacterized protein n=1 Tax=Diaporthe citri TaxID=83186 RepID=UPI001C80AFE8|nr:uncharacterized protein INS49_003315 [Diaporthe citri]KAG6355353.1 hypothetical protein INS49_003315 [Diaporthe citri]
MGSFGANYEDLVPEQDLYYFGNATVKGIRDQLRENGLPTGGLKYQLYLRLVENGLRLYNDNRSDSIGDDQEEDNGEPDNGSDIPFEVDDSELDNSEENYVEGDESESESGEEISEAGDTSSESGDGGKQPPKSDKKRGRDDDDEEDENDNGDPQDRGPPARSRRRLGIALPPELRTIIIENLNAPGVWNLIDSAPEEYLSRDFNALILEARYQYRLDYPPVAPVDTPGSFRKTVPYPWPGPGPERPLSLLEWVARRATLDSRFGTANRTRIMRVIDAYLQVYGTADPGALPMPNEREAILYYFRNRANLLVINHTPLTHAARAQNPGAVQLLLLRGADVNEVVNGMTALEHAGSAGFMLGPLHQNTFQTAYALIGAGADVSVLGDSSRLQSSVALQMLTGDPVPAPGLELPGDFPRIDNLGLSTRQLIADERSQPYERMLLTLFVIFYRTMVYPRYI